MTLTTTTKIQTLENGIVINELITKSGFKPAYLFEQALELNHLCAKTGMPVILDLSKINFSYRELKQIITYQGFKQIKAIAILVHTKTEKTLLQLWFSLIGLDFSFHFFARKEAAVAWLSRDR